MTSETVIRALAESAMAWRSPEHTTRVRAEERTLAEDNRFTGEAMVFAVNQAMSEIDVGSLEKWLGGRQPPQRFRVGVLEAGNVPFAGLQDYLAVILTGHSFVASVSSRSPYLLPAFAAEVSSRGGPDAVFVPQVELFNGVDVVVASGTDETREEVADRCERVGIPANRRLLRGHRFGVAVLDGRESEDERLALAEDALLHDGYGCRNVAVIWAPEDLQPDDVLEAFAVFRGTFPAHPGTSGSLRMQQAFLKAVDAPHAHTEDMAFLVSRGEPDVQPPGHLRWVSYGGVEDAVAWIQREADRIQTVVARRDVLSVLPDTWARCELGTAQRPPLDWHPDGVDTIEFLATLV